MQPESKDHVNTPMQHRRPLPRRVFRRFFLLYQRDYKISLRQFPKSNLSSRRGRWYVGNAIHPGRPRKQVHLDLGQLDLRHNKAHASARRPSLPRHPPSPRLICISVCAFWRRRRRRRRCASVTSAVVNSPSNDPDALITLHLRS